MLFQPEAQDLAIEIADPHSQTGFSIGKSLMDPILQDGHLGQPWAEAIVSPKLSRIKFAVKGGLKRRKQRRCCG